MNNMTYQIVMMLFIFGIMYVLLIRPQKKKEREVNTMRNSIQAGDDIVTIGGIYGKVVKVKEDRLTIQVGADKTKFEITRWAVSTVEHQAKAKAKVVETEEETTAKKPTPKKMKKLGQAEPTADQTSEAAAEATKAIEE